LDALRILPVLRLWLLLGGQAPPSPPLALDPRGRLTAMDVKPWCNALRGGGTVGPRTDGGGPPSCRFGRHEGRLWRATRDSQGRLAIGLRGGRSKVPPEGLRGQHACPLDRRGKRAGPLGAFGVGIDTRRNPPHRGRVRCQPVARPCGERPPNSHLLAPKLRTYLCACGR